VKACGWPVEQIPDAWTTEPITQDLIDQAIDSLKSWRRYVPYDGTQALTMILTSHLGADAIPALLKLVADFPEPLHWQQYHNAGEMLVWLCHQHPKHKARVEVAWAAIDHPNNQSFSYEKETVAAAIARGAKHLWSNA
jgi:hypothetical protein